jgi:hypothetical protein
MTTAANAYRTKNYLWIFGDDFAFYYADQNYKFLDDVISTLKSATNKFEFKFSTPSQYYEAVQKEAQEKKIEFPTHVSDFMPMEQVYKDSFWTGYYTSRPNFKKYIRDLSSTIFSSSNLFALEWFKSVTDSNLTALSNHTQSMS